MFTKETAITLVKSEEQFPVDFEQAWQWLEYSQKGHAKVSLMSCGFIEGVDYLLSEVREQMPSGAKYRHDIKLTINCFTHWAMMSSTPKGKEIRRYFIEAEKELRELQAQQAQPKLEPQEEPMEALAKLELYKESLKLLEAVNNLSCVDSVHKLMLGNAIANIVSTEEKKQEAVVAVKTHPLIRRTVVDRAREQPSTCSC